MRSEIDPELPWGYWLRLERRPSGHVYVDDDGSEWPTVRQAFWSGRLKMPLVLGRTPAAELELLHAVLAHKARRPSTAMCVFDIFEGNRLFAAHFTGWMTANGLLEPTWEGTSPLDYTINAEGLSALLMLTATRPEPVKQMRPEHPSVRQLVELGRGPVPGEARRREVEKAAAGLQGGFTRKHLGRPSIVLGRLGDGPMPVMKTTWSLAFPDEESRDRFYGWMCDRLDRWPEWIRIDGGSRDGAGLTAHLLRVLASERIDSEDAPGAGADNCEHAARLALEHHP